MNYNYVHHWSFKRPHAYLKVMMSLVMVTLLLYSIEMIRNLFTKSVPTTCDLFTCSTAMGKYSVQYMD